MEKFDHRSEENDRIYLMEKNIYDREAGMWLVEQMKHAPVFRKGKVKIDQKNLGLYKGVLAGLTHLQFKSEDLTWREELKLDCYRRELARSIDTAHDQMDEGKKKYKEAEEWAVGIRRNREGIDYAREGLIRGQTMAIEAGLSGINLGKDFKEALNQLWNISVGFGVSEEPNEDI